MDIFTRKKFGLVPICRFFMKSRNFERTMPNSSFNESSYSVYEFYLNFTRVSQQIINETFRAGPIRILFQFDV